MQGPSSAHLAAREAHRWAVNGGVEGEGGKKMELCDVTCAVTQCRQSELRDTQLEEWEEVLTITPPCSPDSARAERLTSGGLSSPLDSGLSDGNITELTFVQSEPLPAHVGLCSSSSFFFFFERGD